MASRHKLLRMLSTRVAAFLVLSSALSSQQSLCAQRETSSLLMVKLGDPAATQDLAAPFLALLTTYLGTRAKRFENLTIEGYITNSETEAVRLFEARRPSLAFVSPGFYLKHLRKPQLDAQVVAMVPRFGSSVDRYHLVVRKDDRAASLSALSGRTVRTSAAIDWPYLRRVVFPRDMLPGEHFVLEPSRNLSDDLFAMTESDDEEEDAPDALLFDQELLQFFASDDLIWPQLKVIWTSAELSRDLVISLGAGWDDALRNQCFAALQEMGEHEAGKKVLHLMRSKGFARPNRELLSLAIAAYDRGPGDAKK